MSSLQPSLPQRRKDEAVRRKALQSARARYGYAPPKDNPLAPVAVAGKHPGEESYSLAWALPYLPHLFRSLATVGMNVLGSGAKALLGRVDKVEAFDALFNPALGIPRPAELDGWQTDGGFTRRWVDGPNPLALARITSLEELRAKAPVGEEEFQRVLPGPRTLACEIAEGRLFVVDYSILEESLLPRTLSRRDSRWRRKYLPAPVVVLCERPGFDPLSDLVPVAIQLDQAGARDPNPLYLPDAGPRWQLARTYVGVADVNMQALSSHIARHHYVAEPFAIATRRQLSSKHPLFLLLEPHIRHTIAVNRQTWNLLKTPSAAFDLIYAGELDETVNVMRQTRLRWPVHTQRLDADLKARGVEIGPVDFPWRDDMRLWLGPVERYVGAYLGLFYTCDRDVLDDWELQAWFAELVAEDGGALHGLTPSGRLETLAELVALAAQFVMLAGPGHAAVHFPQSDYLTYPPFFPGGAFKPPPGPDELVDEERIRQTLPPVSVGLVQFLTNQIANYRFDRFGDFAGYAVSRVRGANGPIARLGADLRHIEQTIELRNQSRPRPYRYLLPSRVPNSINI